MHCKMCNIWDNPTDPKREFRPELLRKLPKLGLVNLTGGEPLVREDLGDDCPGPVHEDGTSGHFHQWVV